jgi:hypothetical protein
VVRFFVLVVLAVLFLAVPFTVVIAHERGA